MNKYQAAREGSKEIFFAVISTSITLAVVFLPILFLEGFVGQTFQGIWYCGGRRCVDILFCFADTNTGTECKTNPQQTRTFLVLSVRQSHSLAEWKTDIADGLKVL